MTNRKLLAHIRAGLPGNVIPQLSQKNNFLPPRRGRIKVGGGRSTMSTPIPTFPPHQGEGV